MRVLCTTTGSASHGRAQLPLLRALAAAGHEVLVVTNPGLASVFEDDDVRVTTVMPDLDPRARMQEQADDMADLPEGDTAALHSAMGRLMFRGMAGAGAKISLEAVFPTAKEFQPDLILRDGMDMGACLIAERLGIPHLPTPSGAVNILDPADVLPYLNASREEVGLPTHDDPLSIAPHGRVDCVPPEFTFARNLPPTFSYRQTVDVERASVLPRWVAELPTDRPLVYAAIGTALPKMLEIMGDAEGEIELPPGSPTPRPRCAPSPTQCRGWRTAPSSSPPRASRWTPTACRRTSTSPSGCRSRSCWSPSTCSSPTAASTASVSRCAPPPRWPSCRSSATSTPTRAGWRSWASAAMSPTPPPRASPPSAGTSSPTTPSPPAPVRHGWRCWPRRGIETAVGDLEKLAG